MRRCQLKQKIIDLVVIRTPSAVGQPAKEDIYNYKYNHCKALVMGVEKCGIRPAGRSVPIFRVDPSVWRTNGFPRS